MGRCEWCRYSEGTQVDKFVYCNLMRENKTRAMICGDFQREPGSDDNKEEP